MNGLDLQPLADAAERARAAWRRYEDADDDSDGALYEAYVTASVAVVDPLLPVVERLAEANVFAISCEDGTGSFVRLAVDEAREEDARLVLYSSLVTARSDRPPELLDLAGGRIAFDVLVSGLSGATEERMAALESALRESGCAAHADEPRKICSLLRGEH